MSFRKNASQNRTTLISVPPHLAEYAKNSFASGRGDGSVVFPSHSTLHHALVDGMRRPLPGEPAATGNLLVVLPWSRLADEGPVKNPFYYCRVSHEAACRIAIALRHRFNYEFLTLMMDNELHGRPETHLRLIRRFLRSHGIRSLSEDALVKKFRRYRMLVCPRRVRKYTKKRRN